MNAQLLVHMETYDSDEEYSDDAELYETDSAAFLDPIDAARLRTKAKIRKFVKPKNFNDVLLKILALIPVVIALRDYVGFFWSMTVSLISLIFLQLRPPPVTSIKSQQRRVSRRSSTGMLKQQQRRRLSSRGSLTSSSSITSKGGTAPKTAASILDLMEMTKQQVHDCRKETSRLLGLIGAPPLEWTQLDSTKLMMISMMPRKYEKDTSLAGDVTVASSQIITDHAMKSVVKFLEAHVGLLLTVDHAYYWLKVSASLHWGLGPHSQCIERVERAAIAKEFRNSRRQSISGSLLMDGIQSPLEPQRKLDTSSVLALSSTRRNLAQSLIDQSLSLVNTYKRVRGWDIENEEQNEASIHDNCFQNGCDMRSMMDDKVLVFPNVVDLSWIRESRKHLAGLLSYTVNHYCTINGLQVLSEDVNKRSKLDESMFNARSAREYLLCNLLLGKMPSAKSALDENWASKDELMTSLLLYREQLEAMSAVLWSCQQYSTFRNPASESDVVLSAAEILKREEEKESSKLAWWVQLKDLSLTCQALQNEIEAKFFTAANISPSLEANDNGATFTDRHSPHQKPESGNYEHECSILVQPNQRIQVSSISKTMVFSGKGSVEKQQIATTSLPGGCQQSTNSLPSPMRDTVAEQRLLRELQNRIRSVVQREEEEQGSVEENEGLSKELDEILDDECDDDSGDWGSDERSPEEKDDVSGISGNSDEEDERISVKPVYAGDVRERESASALFLGASGSLLAELKKNIPQGGAFEIGTTVGMDEEKTEGALIEEE
jgi:hypothetical protein